MKSLRLHPEAEQELEEAFLFYEGQAAGLSGEFLDEINRVFRNIREMPWSGSPEESGARRSLLRRFPFTVVYELDHQHVTVLAVAHQRKWPRYWYGRRES